MLTYKEITETIEKYKFYLPYKGGPKFFAVINHQAKQIVAGNVVKEVDFDQICDTLLKENFEKAQDAYEAEMALLYNDEVVEIEEIGDMELMDIQVSRDNLFYANGVLTKNSAGLPATADFMVAMIETEQLAEAGLQLLKQIKSRYNDKNRRLRFPIKVLKARQRWEVAEQNELDNNLFDNGIIPTPEKQAGPTAANTSNVPRSTIDAMAKEIKF